MNNSKSLFLANRRTQNVISGVCHDLCSKTRALIQPFYRELFLFFLSFVKRLKAKRPHFYRSVGNQPRLPRALS